MIDHDKAAEIISSTDVARAEQNTTRAKALASGEKPSAPRPRSKPATKNVVEREMTLDSYHQKVFSRVRDAVSAAERACQKAKDTVQSEKEMDAAVEHALTDLEQVIGVIRDERKDIIREPATKSNLLYMS